MILERIKSSQFLFKNDHVPSRLPLKIIIPNNKIPPNKNLKNDRVIGPHDEDFSNRTVISEKDQHKTAKKQSVSPFNRSCIMSAPCNIVHENINDVF